MNQKKATFFDSQVDEPWAAAAYGADEMAKVDRMLQQAQLREGMRVVEPGCGTGRLTVILADIVGPGGSVLAFDISTKMVKAARTRLGNRSHVSLQCGTAETYSFDPKGFDAVVCHNVFPHFDDKAAAVQLLAATLKPAGRFIVFHFMHSAWINDLHRKSDSAVLHDMIPEPAEMERLFKSAGLKIDSLTDDDRGYLLCATCSTGNLAHSVDSTVDR